VLLEISVVDYASVIDYTSNSFSWVLINLPGMCWCQIISWWPLVCTLRSLVAIPLLSTIPCEVTRFSTEETCEDFSLSVFLDRFSGVPSFSATSYALVVSVSSGEEIFYFCYSRFSSSWRSIHCVMISWGIIVPWFVDWWWAWSCFEPICLILHVTVGRP
jgi:hypothetical protein